MDFQFSLNSMAAWDNNILSICSAQNIHYKLIYFSIEKMEIHRRCFRIMENSLDWIALKFKYLDSLNDSLIDFSTFAREIMANINNLQWNTRRIYYLYILHTLREFTKCS